MFVCVYIVVAMSYNVAPTPIGLFTIISFGIQNGLGNLSYSLLGSIWTSGTCFHGRGVLYHSVKPSSFGTKGLETKKMPQDSRECLSLELVTRFPQIANWMVFFFKKD